MGIVTPSPGAREAQCPVHVSGERLCVCKQLRCPSGGWTGRLLQVLYEDDGMTFPSVVPAPDSLVPLAFHVLPCLPE